MAAAPRPAARQTLCRRRVHPALSRRAFCAARAFGRVRPRARPVHSRDLFNGMASSARPTKRLRATESPGPMPPGREEPLKDEALSGLGAGTGTGAGEGGGAGEGEGAPW
jgi:hypothetical protein